MPGPALGVHHCSGKLHLERENLAWRGDRGNVNSLDKGLESEQDEHGEGTWKEGCPLMRLKRWVEWGTEGPWALGPGF